MTFIAITADYAKLRKVRRALRRKGVEAYLPAIVHKRPVLKSAKIKYRRRITPLMSYILAKAPEHDLVRDLWLYDILQTKDVRGYVKSIDRPALIVDADVEALKEAVAQIRRELDKQRHKRGLRTGDRAANKKTGKTGTIQWLTKKGAGLEMMMFGSLRTVVVRREDLEAA